MERDKEDIKMAKQCAFLITVTNTHPHTQMLFLKARASKKAKETRGETARDGWAGY
jgi:hypothetical protein